MKDKKIILYLLILSTFLLSMMALLAYADTEVTAGARASALYNPDTKTFLYQSNANERLPMASTTKIVTALIAIETLDLDEVIQIPKEAVGIEGSSLYLKENEELTIKNLVYGVLLQSANDAAAALALHISGSIADFAELMTQRVTKIGAYDTNFKNPHGLDDKEHYTTAHDLSLIAAEAMSNETFKQISGTYKYSFNIGENTRCVVNHNKLLKNYDGCIGVKTGFTKKSGRCLVSAAERDGITLIAVTLDDPDDWKDHKNLLNYGFDSLEAINLNNLVTIPQTLPSISADFSRLSIKLKNDTIVKQKNETIECYIDLPSYIVNDISTGDKVGSVTVRIGNHLENVDIIATCDLKIKKNSRRFF